MTSGPASRIRVAVTGADKLVWFDAGSTVPTMHEVNTGGPSDCGPVAVTDGGDSNIYYSLPSDGTCHAGVSSIGRVAADGTGATTRVESGEAFGLLATGGKLYVPDFGGDAIVRRAEPGLGSESTIATAAGSGPDQLAVSPSGEIWATLYSGNGVARFSPTQNGGNATTVPLAAGLLAEPGGNRLRRGRRRLRRLEGETPRSCGSTAPVGQAPIRCPRIRSRSISRSPRTEAS